MSFHSKLRLRPDLGPLRARFDLADAEGAVGVRFFGVTTVLIDDSRTKILVDGFFSRPSLLTVAAKKVAPLPERINAALAASRTAKLNVVVATHTHYDHALDSATVASMTGAVLVGGESCANLAHGAGLPSSQRRLAVPGEPFAVDDFELTLFPARHSPPERYVGDIVRPLAPAQRARRYRCGDVWSLLVTHCTTDHTVLIHPSAGYRPGALAGVQAEVVYLGIGQLGAWFGPLRRRRTEYVRAYWEETVRTVGARRVVLIHWDDMFISATPELRAMRRPVDDLEVSLALIDELAGDGVHVSLPSTEQRADPWTPPVSHRSPENAAHGSIHLP